MERKRIYVFDFDGTLTCRDTLLAFIRHVAGLPAFLWGFLLHAPWLLLMLLRLYPNWKAKQRVFSHFFKGMTEADFDANCRSFAHTHLHLLRAAGVDFIQKMGRQGEHMVVVSASVDRWVKPFFDHLLPLNGAPDIKTRCGLTVIGTEIEVEEGRLTGRFLTPNCYGAEKVRRLREALPDVDHWDVVAFGDSRGDKELLAMAAEAHYKPFREKKLRWFHLISHFDLGGAEQVAMNISASDNPAIEYHIVEIMRGRSAYTRGMLAELRRKGIVCHRGWMPDVRFHFLFERITALLFPLWFLFIFLKWRPQVIHSHTEGPDLCLLSFAKMFPWLVKKCRIVRTIHNTRLWTGQQRLGRIAERWFQSVGANVAISEAVQQSYQQHYGERPCIIYNGVPQVPQRAYPHLVPNKVNVLFAGRMEPQKGIATLISIVEQMADDNRYHFHVMGDGSLRPEVQQRLSGLPNVSIVPPLHGLSSYLSSFHYMLMPSEFEGLSIVSMEASMASLPNIINDAPGLGETMPPDWPLKVQHNELEAYLHLFREVIPLADRTALQRQCREYAVENFGVKSMRQRYEEMVRIPSESFS